MPTTYYEDAAAQQLLRKVLNQQPIAPSQFHLVTIFEGREPAVQTYSTIDALLQEMHDLGNSAVYTFAFMGHYMPISKGPFRYLMSPLGALPLFVPPSADSLEPDLTGWLGSTDEREALTQAVTLHEQAVGAQTSLPDDAADCLPMDLPAPPDDLTIH